ncbi:MAG: ThuA domain-containing protein [Candidatus Sumerlaeaceae bacterium]
MAKKALIVWGGWEGHQPRQVAEIFQRVLLSHSFEVELSNTLDSFRDLAALQALQLIVPVYTMATIEKEHLEPLLAAVKGGVGIGGCHGGMCDAFRLETEYQFMTGGQWVAHPGNDGTTYRVNIIDKDHYITRDIADFDVCSEQYYMHVDPAVKVLASTRFPIADGPHVGNGPVDMPVTWTKLYGKGRVFYCSLGHQASIVEMPPVMEMCTRGLLWASGVGS